MKRNLLLAIATLLLTTYSIAQDCTSDYDFGDGVVFGVSPDPNLGETFLPGEVGDVYYDVIDILVPDNAGDIDIAFDGYIIDSLDLTGVSIQIGADFLPISAIGLEVICNNNGDSQNECTFLGGSQYCADISGTPTQAGDYPLTINVQAYLVILGQPQSIPYFFDSYTLHIDTEGTTSITESKVPTLNVEQNVPNPFKNTTTIKYTTNQVGSTHMIVRNLLGEIVFEENFNSKRGENIFKFDGSALNSGIYMYSLETNGNKITKRMVINK